MFFILFSLFFFSPILFSSEFILIFEFKEDEKRMGEKRMGEKRKEEKRKKKEDLNSKIF